MLFYLNFQQIGKTMPAQAILIVVNIRKRRNNGAINDYQVHQLWDHLFKVHNGANIVIHRKAHNLHIKEINQ